MNKLTDRQKQAIDTKLRITKTASQLFKSKGFDNVKIQDICDNADISIGAFYHHFKSKSEIINIAYEQVDILLMDKFHSNEFSSNIEKLLFLFEEGADMMEELGYVFVGEIYKNLISVQKKYSTKPDRHIALAVKSIVKSAIQDKELECNISPNDLTMIIMRICRGTIFDWCLHNGHYNLKSKISFDLNLVLSNYKINSLK